MLTPERETGERGSQPSSADLKKAARAVGVGMIEHALEAATAEACHDVGGSRLHTEAFDLLRAERRTLVTQYTEQTGASLPSNVWYIDPRLPC